MPFFIFCTSTTLSGVEKVVVFVLHEDAAVPASDCARQSKGAASVTTLGGRGWGPFTMSAFLKIVFMFCYSKNGACVSFFCMRTAQHINKVSFRSRYV